MVFVFMHAEACRRIQSDQSWQKSKQRPQCQFWIYHAMTFVGALCWLLLHFDVSCAFSFNEGLVSWHDEIGYDIGFFDKAEVFFHPFRGAFRKYIAWCRQSDIIWIRWVSNWNPMTILQSQKVPLWFTYSFVSERFLTHWTNWSDQSNRAKTPYKAWSWTQPHKSHPAGTTSTVTAKFRPYRPILMHPIDTDEESLHAFGGFVDWSFPWCSLDKWWDCLICPPYIRLIKQPCFMHITQRYLLSLVRIGRGRKFAQEIRIVSLAFLGDNNCHNVSFEVSASAKRIFACIWTRIILMLIDVNCVQFHFVVDQVSRFEWACIMFPKEYQQIL